MDRVVVWGLLLAAFFVEVAVFFIAWLLYLRSLKACVSPSASTRNESTYGTINVGTGDDDDDDDDTDVLCNYALERRYWFCKSAIHRYTLGACIAAFVGLNLSALGLVIFGDSSRPVLFDIHGLGSLTLQIGITASSLLIVFGILYLPSAFKYRNNTNNNNNINRR